MWDRKHVRQKVLSRVRYSTVKSVREVRRRQLDELTRGKSDLTDAHRSLLQQVVGSNPTVEQHSKVGRFLFGDIVSTDERVGRHLYPTSGARRWHKGVTAMPYDQLLAGRVRHA